jgi:hypothetical protein
MGDGVQQHFALGPNAQLGSREKCVAKFLAEIMPKEAKGGRCMVAKMAISGVVQCGLALGYFLGKKQETF